MNARRLLVWVLIVGGILLAAVVGSRRADQGLPLDPSSPGPNGTKALVETLRVLGAKVSVSSELPSDGGTALLLADDLSEQRRARLLDWVRQGGTLVVADPSSRVTRVEPIGDTRIGLLDAELEPTCAVPAMRDVRRVSAPGGIVFRVPAGAQGCFPRGHGAWLVVQPAGSGTVVRLGGASALVNQRINRTDNAVLIVGLLSPAPGPEVVVLRPPPPGGGSKGLSDLIAPRVKLTLVQLVVAFLLLALWRSRRLGRPVTEPTAVRIPGSELVVAVGNLPRRPADGGAARPPGDRQGGRRSGRGGLRPGGRPAGAWSRPARGRAGCREDAAGQDAGSHPRLELQAGPVHSRPDALRHPRPDDLPAARRLLPVPGGTGVHQPAAGRRDQPNTTQDPGRAPGGHGGAAGDGRGAGHRAARPLPGRRHPEPDRVRGHLPAARGPTRPLPVQAGAPLSDRRAGAVGAGSPRGGHGPARPRDARRQRGRRQGRPGQRPQGGRRRPGGTARAGLHRVDRPRDQGIPVARAGGVAPRRRHAAPCRQGVGLAGGQAVRHP